MTVINAISFGNEGVIIADEQASTANRKYNFTEKIQDLDKGLIFAGTGSLHPIMEVYNFAKEELGKLKESKKAVSHKEIHDLLTSIIISYKNTGKDKLLNANLGFGLDDLITGTLARNGQSLDQPSKELAKNYLMEFDNMMSLSIILAGLENGKFNIYEANTSGTGTQISLPYVSAGSGKDESEKVLSRYITNLKRADRDSIDKKEGLVKIIEATNAASNINIGVGGIPSIAYIGEKGIVRPLEPACLLATELVTLLEAGYLPKDFTQDATSSLVYEGADFREIDSEMKKRATDWEQADRFLRGYK
tara:strand:+ start:474 stop:1391 length:918 start_codon:yes stop_codon:yes gene_type:complete